MDEKGPITDEVAQRFGLAKGTDLFNLTVYEDPGKGRIERLMFRTVPPGGSRRLDRVLEAVVELHHVQEKPNGDPDLPAKPAPSKPEEDPVSGSPAGLANGCKKFTGGADSAPLTANDIVGDKANKTGLYMLDKADLFNLLCIPPDTRDGDTSTSAYQEAMKYCTDRRAMLIVDSPARWCRTRTLQHLPRVTD